jgi:glycosyltransferase involved in cell wall biosynthesis
LRVGFDARWYNDSGVGNYVAGLLRALAEPARDLELLVYEDPENCVPDLDDLPIRRIPVLSSTYSFRSQFDLARRCRGDELDIFHSPFFVIPFAASCPVVVTFHDIIPFIFPIYSPAKRWMVKTGYRMAAHRATHVIADSGATARDVQTILRVPLGKVSQVHLAVSREYFHPGDDDGEFGDIQTKYGISRPYVVVASPRNWRTKNLAAAFEALASAHKRSGKKFKTVIYGPGNGSDALANVSRSQGLDVIQTGFISAKVLGSVFRHAAAFVFPSLYEGFGLPLLEAMSCGCPVVTSNGGSLAEVAGSGAQVFDPMDIAAMAQAVARLVGSAEEQDLWRARALARASDFSWQKTAEQTAAVYRQVCRHPAFQQEPTPGLRNDAESPRY